MNDLYKNQRLIANNITIFADSGLRGLAEEIYTEERMNTPADKTIYGVVYFIG